MTHPDRYLPTNDALLSAARAEELAGSSALLNAAVARKDEISQRIRREASTASAEELRYWLGIEAGLDFVLALPGQARQYLEGMRNP